MPPLRDMDASPCDRPTLLKVRVVPGARRSEVLVGDDGTLRVRVAAPAVDGKANAELLRVLAAHLGVRERCLSIARGEHHRTKLVALNR